MAFRASNQIPAQALEQAKAIAWSVKSLASRLASEWAGGAQRRIVLQEWRNLKGIRTSLAELATAPGLAAYAQAQESDANYNVATEFNALLAAIDAVTNAIEAAFPKTGAFLLVEQFSGSTVASGTFTGAEMTGSGIVGLLSSLAAQVS